MAALTAATTSTGSAGDATRLTFTFTSVADADTFASGLGTRVRDYSYQRTGSTATGASVEHDGNGGFTFHPGTDAETGTLVVDVSGA